MSEYKRTVLNYTGLLSTLSEIQLVFYASMYGHFRLLTYLKSEHSLPDIKHNFKLIDSEKNEEQLYQKEYLIKALESISKYYNKDFNHYVEKQLFRTVVRLTKENLITNTYELIKNYSDLHPELDIMKHMVTLDWFQMLHMLRRNAAHFNNIGKQIGGWHPKYPPIIKWQGLEIHKALMGHEIEFTEIYALDLVKQCQSYVRDNKVIFSNN